MRRAVQLIESDQLQAALVHLWVIAGTRRDGATLLNRWERDRDSNEHASDVLGFRRLIHSGRAPALTEALRAPLALIEALDAELEALTEPQAFVPRKFVEGHLAFWLVRIDAEARHRARIAQQANNREAWFRWHAVIPATTASGIEVVVRQAEAQAAHDLGRILERGEGLRTWIGHFRDQEAADGGVRLLYEENSAARFRCTGVTNPEKRLDSIRESWASAKKADAQIAILPELTVTLEHRAEVRGWLESGDGGPLVLVLAGSFHETVDGDSYNTAELWDRKGERLLAHRKLRPYGAADGLAEDIADGNRLEVLATPIGAFAIPICKDYLDDHPKVAALFSEVPVDWILVPSYGDEKTVKLHKDRARKVAHFSPGATTIVANQRNVEKPNVEKPNVEAKEGAPCPGFAFPALESRPNEVGVEGGLVVLSLRVAGGRSRRGLRLAGESTEPDG